MIFVTVGTHEQPFNRLVEHIDVLKKNHKIEDDIIIQTGYSTYQPKYCSWKKLYPYQQMLTLVKEARIVITHGGPSSIIMPLQIGKVPIVVPRQHEFGEHVNNHQIDFVNAVSNKLGIIVIKDMEKLSSTVKNYNKILEQSGSVFKSNNIKFTSDFEKIVNEMF